MKLDPLHRQLAVTHAHDLAVIALRGDLEAGWKTCALDHQRMIARRGQRTVQALEYTRAAMRHFGELAVHDARGTDDPATERLPDRLVAQTDAENGNLAGEAFDE